ncbi:hypothetical protein PINS_up007760 [Pythium insidiosum]|nr:hypothetical protein PINS_up007760 [Pythium insidiosum]
MTLALQLALQLALLLSLSAWHPVALSLPLRRSAQHCGNDLEGVLPCPDGQYCERLTAFHYVCRARPFATRGEPLHGVDLAPDDRNGHPSMGGTQVKFCTPLSCAMLCYEVPDCVGFVFLSVNTVERDDVCRSYQCKVFSAPRATPRARDNAITWFIDRSALCPSASRSICGSRTRVTSCCPRGERCLPRGQLRQCTPFSPQCSAPESGSPMFYYVDYIGTGMTQDECCELCATSPGCVRYRYDASVNGECAVFSILGPPRFSSTRAFADPITRLPPCEKATGDACGDSTSGASCCPLDSYCQPLNSTSFQCTKRLPQCAKQVPQSELKGSDLEVLTVANASECCDKCYRSPTCKAYTYVNDDPRGQLCKLKADSNAERVFHPTAITGFLNSLFT